MYYVDSDLRSVGVGGGRPELVYKDISSAALSPDDRQMALIRHDSGTGYGSVWFASPPGTEPRPYLEAPFTDHRFNEGILRFSPQGDRVVAWVWRTGEPTEFWILPLKLGKPYQVLRRSTADCLFPAPFSVLPDGRHLVPEIQPRPDWTVHLFVADLEQDTMQPLTRTTLEEIQPAVSRDGSRIAFTVRDNNYDLVQVRSTARGWKIS